MMFHSAAPITCSTALHLGVVYDYHTAYTRLPIPGTVYHTVVVVDSIRLCTVHTHRLDT
jgi:hypothetical protein